MQQQQTKKKTKKQILKMKKMPMELTKKTRETKLAQYATIACRAAERVPD